MFGRTPAHSSLIHRCPPQPRQSDTHAHTDIKNTHRNVRQSCTSSDSQLNPSETSSHLEAPRHGHKTNYADWHFGTSLCEDKQRRVPSQRRVAIFRRRRRVQKESTCLCVFKRCNAEETKLDILKKIFIGGSELCINMCHRFGAGAGE